MKNVRRLRMLVLLLELRERRAVCRLSPGQRTQHSNFHHASVLHDDGEFQIVVPVLRARMHVEHPVQAIEKDALFLALDPLRDLRDGRRHVEDHAPSYYNSSAGETFGL